MGVNGVHVWYAFVPQWSAECAGCHFHLLDAQEQTRHAQLVFPEDRHRYLVTRVLARSVLSRYVPIRPQEWVFKRGQYGRPTIGNTHALCSSLQFSLTHTHGLVALAVAFGRAVGIDAENAQCPAPMEVADPCFTAHERQAMAVLPDEERPDRFWKLWTLKESYCKARGMGLALPMDRFSMHFDESAGISAAFDADIEDSPQRWQFTLLRPDALHTVALCHERVDANTVEIVCWNMQPMGAFAPMVACSMPLQADAGRQSSLPPADP